ncbi:MAG: potassium channel family protein [Planctomycetaceae bacterium]
MRLIAAIFGIANISLVLVDAFEAMVLPRRATRRYRPARLFYRSLWIFWRIAARWFRPGAQRQHFLSVFGPLSLLALFACWVAGLVFSFALFHWSLAVPLGDESSRPSLAECLYLSGETFFTLGYGDLAPTAWVGRFLSVLESGMGFGFMAVVIGYLPVLYQAFSRRELVISLLDARAGSPPTAGELLRRLARTSDVSKIDKLLWEWETWSADLLESQLSFPVLAYYRSQHDNQSWLAGLAAILDTCSVLLANVPGIDRHQVQITFAMARHAAVDLALIFRTPPCESANERLPAARFQQFLEDLNTFGLKVDSSGSPSESLNELRRMYEPFLEGLAAYFLFELPPIIADEVPADNWQRSAWLERAPGIGYLPSIRTGDHFS